MATYYSPGMGRSKIKPGDILINTSTFQPAHCGIVVANCDVIHATGKGIISTDIDLWRTEAEMFRMTPALSDADAAKVVRIAGEIMGSAQYGVSRAIFKSTFSSGAAGNNLFARLAKYRERLQNEQGVVKNVYCSELVILSYQLACIMGDTIDNTNRMFINLDGKHTWPSTLRRYLKNSINWTHLGELKPR